MLVLLTGVLSILGLFHQIHHQYVNTSFNEAGIAHIMTKKQSVWGDLDISSQVKCGGFKCFIQSISDSEVGYLISRDVNIFKDMIKATEVALEIEREYGAKHFYIADESPLLLSMPEETRSRVNEKARNALLKKEQPQFFLSPSVVVQKMKAAKDSSLFFACYHPNSRLTQAQLPSFALAVVEQEGDIDEFKRNIAKERSTLRKMILDRPGFGADLQALVSKKGEFFFIDLDAHVYWSKWEKSWFKTEVAIRNCDKKFDAIDQALNERGATMV
jgi:hypothetical protein